MKNKILELAKKYDLKEIQDLTHEKIKSYYIKSITDLSFLDESYLSEQMMQELAQSTSGITSPWFCEEEKSVLLKVTDEAMLYLKRKKDSMLTTVEETDSHLLMQMKYYNDTEVLVFVKKWLPFVSIEENDMLKEKLQKILTISLENYR